MKHSFRSISIVLLIFLLAISSTAGRYAFAKSINNGAMANCPMMTDMGSDQSKKMSGDCYHKGCPCDMSLCGSAFYLPSITLTGKVHFTIMQYDFAANQPDKYVHIDIPTAPPKHIS